MNVGALCWRSGLVSFLFVAGNPNHPVFVENFFVIMAKAGASFVPIVIPRCCENISSLNLNILLFGTYLRR